MAKLKPTDQFSPEICQRLRKLAMLRNKAMTKRKDAFDARDEIEEQIGKCTEGEVKKKERLKAEHYDVVHDIQRWQSLYKITNNKIVEAIEKGDDPELFPTLNPNPTEKSLFAEDLVIGGGDADGDEDGDGEEAAEPEMAGAVG